jgi:hypothetical protein
VPDALEVVRRTAVSDSLHVAESAERAAERVRRAQVRTELERIARAARLQAERLGGVYDSGVGGETERPDASPSAEATSTRDVVVALDDAAARSRAAADITEDGPLARLLASIGASWTVSAVRLTEVTPGPDLDPVTPVIPAPQEADAPGDEGTDEPTPARTDGGEDETTVSTTAPDSPEASVAPEGLTADELSALVVSEDSIGFALQLRAARSDGSLRDRLLARSRTHRERAQAWAALARTDGTGQDPRRVAYVVPSAADAGDVALVRTLENHLAVDYASLVGTSTAGTRAVLVDLVIDASLAGEDWGARPSAFPGLPEQAGNRAGS